MYDFDKLDSMELRELAFIFDSCCQNYLEELDNNIAKQVCCFSVPANLATSKIDKSSNDTCHAFENKINFEEENNDGKREDE